MKVISFDAIAGLGIGPETCLRWVEEALTHKEEAVLPKKISMKHESLPGVFYNCMPCVVPGAARAGVKIVTRYPGREPSLDSEMLLYDTASGECLAFMDADWIATMRTGAVAAHSARLLGTSGFRRVGFMGLGNTARATMLCLRAAVGCAPLEIGLLRYKGQETGFRERFAGMGATEFLEFEDPRELARWSQVLFSCVTVAEGEICPPEDFAPGALLVPVHTRGFARCDLAFDRVFADDVAHVSSFGYYEQFKDRLSEVADIVAGRDAGRRSGEERILAYNIGIALHDVVFASKVYDLCVEGKPEISLEKPQEKFWV